MRSEAFILDFFVLRVSEEGRCQAGNTERALEWIEMLLTSTFT